MFRLKVREYAIERQKFGPQRPLQTTIELEFTDSGVVVLNLATRNAKSKAQLVWRRRRRAKQEMAVSLFSLEFPFLV